MKKGHDMNKTTLKISLAGLMHDIGKFAQGCIKISPQYANDNADQYQPFYNNKHSHVHSLYTAAFIEKFAGVLPVQLNSGGWGEADSFINLAAGHHKPETPFQWIIAEADRMSSGLDRVAFEEGEKIAFQDFRKTRLLPIFEPLGEGRHPHYAKRSDFTYRYPLDLLSANSIFPLRATEKSMSGEAQQDYQRLFDLFIENLAMLQDRQNDIALWIEHFDSLLRTCTSMVPAARVGDVIHDVSLYDHSRSTAAFATALYLYHNETNDFSERSIRNRSEPKFLLVTGDFYGIQDFIFAAGGHMNRFRSKLLRGRSFAVSLFSELAADHLCREIGIPSLSVVLNAAGKFTLIAPNTAKAREAVASVETKINDWLYDLSFGESSIGFAATPCAACQFHSDAFASLFDAHSDAVQERKLSKVVFERYAGTVEGYLETFDAGLDHKLCGLCGKRAAKKSATEDYAIIRGQVEVCPVCRDHVMIGTMLVKNSFLFVHDSCEISSAKNSLLCPVFDKYQVEFRDSFEDDHLDSTRMLRRWQLGANENGSLLSMVTSRPLNGYIPLYRHEDLRDDRILESRRQEKKTEELIEQIEIGMPKTFAHIGVQAKIRHTANGSPAGTEAIGVLKADVDNLGMLLGCGLPEKRYSLSRLATLSRQLDAFFSLYLPQLLRQSNDFQDVYTVFAGGDDLFLIGPWNRMVPLAMHLQQRFSDYVCGNEQLTFSAGITSHKSHVPVNKLSYAAEAALEQAKDAPGKNSITVFGQTVKWSELTALMENKRKMEQWLEEKTISSAMLYRFNQMIELAGREKVALAQGEVRLDALDAVKWRAMFSYSVQRNINSSLKGKEREAAITDVSLMADWMNCYGAAVVIPLWHLLYDKRA